MPEPMAVDDIAELARRLRDADHLEPEARAELADLLHELAEALDQPEPSAQDRAIWPEHRAPGAGLAWRGRARPDRGGPGTAGGSGREGGGEVAGGDRDRPPPDRHAVRPGHLSRPEIRFPVQPGGGDGRLEGDLASI